MEKTNLVTVGGTLIERNEGYCVLLSNNPKRASTVQVWDIPDHVEIGDEITVIGKFATKLVSFYDRTRKVFGVEAAETTKIKFKEEVLVSGVITTIGTLDKREENSSLTLYIKVDDYLHVQIVFWSALAEYMAENCKVGDHIFVSGCLYSRKYVWMDEMGKARNRIATQVSAWEVKKLD